MLRRIVAIGAGRTTSVIGREAAVAAQIEPLRRCAGRRPAFGMNPVIRNVASAVIDPGARRIEHRGFVDEAAALVLQPVVEPFEIRAQRAYPRQFAMRCSSQILEARSAQSAAADGSRDSFRE